MTRERVCIGFDGSSSDDWTAIRIERDDYWQSTPTYGPDGHPTIWDPSSWGGSIPRADVNAAVDELFDRFDVERMYCDPPGWQSEIDRWASKYGDDHVIEWPTYRVTQMHAALDRFVTDLTTGLLTHDGCPITATHVANARKLARPGDKYILGKPNQNQKIDVAMASVLAHEAAADAHASGWVSASKDSYAYIF